MRNTLGLAMAAVLAASGNAMAQGADYDAALVANYASTKPTIVLVHGAFADSSSWNGVIEILSDDGYRTIAAANHLRTIAGSVADVSAIVRSIPGPVVLVGHSFGGMVITGAANGNPNVTALVYVAGFMPDAGESANALVARFPGTMINEAVAPVALADGGLDLYIKPELFHDVFAASLPEERTQLMAVTQRPLTLAAADEPASVAAWKTLPSYAIYGVEDRIIPAALVAFMAERAQAVRTIAIEGAPHAVMISHPGEVAALIEEAANASSAITTLVQGAAAVAAP